jgi:hypothetical protein
MTKHTTHRIHPNSRESYLAHDASTRAQQVLAVLRERCEPMTDREIANALGSQDMNYARPSVSRLIDEGKLRELPKVVCKTTGRKVRRAFFPWALGGTV